MKKVKDILNKVWDFLKTVGVFLKKVFHAFLRIFKARAMSTQLIVTIILIFASFFLLQTFLNNTFFATYYSRREFNRIQENIDLYIETIENNEISNEHYDAIFDYTSENNAYSVIVDWDYNILRSSYTNYTIRIKDVSTEDEYTFIVQNNDYSYELNDYLTIDLINFNEDLSSPLRITQGDSNIYNSGFSCESGECITVNAQVIEINKPNNLNYLFDNNVTVQEEISKLQQVEDESTLLEEYEGGYWYLSTDSPIETLVFVNNLKYNKVVTFVPIVNTNDVIDIISGYNYYIYLTALVIIFLWSFRMSSIISKPIQNIELIAREIAQLNFNVEAHEYNNRENESLSRSINLISRNLKETLDTISAKNNELTSLYEEQSNQVALKKQLVSSISHELKTPLMIMQVTIQGILDGIIDEEEVDKELNNLLEEISKSSFMIQDMLQIYRLDDANTQLDITYFNLSNTVKFFISDFEKALQKYGFKLDLEIQDDVFIEADCKLIKRVISNFITNAIKYTPEKELIEFKVLGTEDHAIFELTNYGTTIPEKDIENVWLPFYRLEQEDTTKRKTKGSGVGLYLVSEILKAHNADYGMVSGDNYVKTYFKIKKH